LNVVLSNSERRRVATCRREEIALVGVRVRVRVRVSFVGGE